MAEARGGPTGGDVRAAHVAELQGSTRSTAIVGGIMILVAWPLWGLYDRVAEPDLADRFWSVRIGVLVPVLLVWLLLLNRPFGERHAAPLALVAFGLPQVAIAWMLPQTADAFEGYLLGYSLVMYGSAFLLVGRLWLTGTLVSLSWVALATAYGIQADRAPDGHVPTIIFYLGTATVLSVVGRSYRLWLERKELAARLALLAEQERTMALVAELDRLSREDSLTRVANRRAWDEALERACADADRTGRPMAVLLLDVDRFKDINDEFGHRRGDEVLQEVAGCLNGRIRASDLLARVGGDEFAVLCSNTGPEAARNLAGDLADLVQAMPGDLSVSIGSAVHWPGADPDSLVGLADRRLYQAKHRRVDRPDVAVR